MMRNILLSFLLLTTPSTFAEENLANQVSQIESDKRGAELYGYCSVFYLENEESLSEAQRESLYDAEIEQFRLKQTRFDSYLAHTYSEEDLQRFGKASIYGMYVALSNLENQGGFERALKICRMLAD